MIIWLDGALMPLEDARISPLDHGLTVGDGVFETMRVYDGVPFAWRRHLQRLAVSAAGLGLELPDVGGAAQPPPSPSSTRTDCATHAFGSPSPAAPRLRDRRAVPAGAPS